MKKKMKKKTALDIKLNSKTNFQVCIPWILRLYCESYDLPLEFFNVSKWNS